MQIALIIVGSIVSWILLGSLLGRLSWWVWHEEESRGLLAYVLFPVSFGEGQIGYGKTPFISGFEIRDNYLYLMAVVWPFKLLWSVGGLIIGSVIGMFIMIIKGPVEVVRILRDGIERPPEPEVEEPKPEPEEEKPAPLVNPVEVVRWVDEALVTVDKMRRDLVALKTEIQEDPEAGKILDLQSERPCA